MIMFLLMVLAIIIVVTNIFNTVMIVSADMIVISIMALSTVK